MSGRDDPVFRDPSDFRRAAGLFLSKWYLDCVSGDGRAFLGYSAILRWKSASVRYASALVARQGGEVVTRSWLTPCAKPTPAAGGIHWSSRRIGIDGVWRPLAPPIRAADLTEVLGRLGQIARTREATVASMRLQPLVARYTPAKRTALMFAGAAPPALAPQTVEALLPIREGAPRHAEGIQGIHQAG